jgi:hypothetical protein
VSTPRATRVAASGVPKKAEAYFFTQQQILRRAFKARIECHQIRAELDLARGGHLLGPKAAVPRYVRIVTDNRKDNRDAALSSGRNKPAYRIDLSVKVSGQR